MMVLPESGGLQPPQPPGLYAYVNKWVFSLDLNRQCHSSWQQKAEFQVAGAVQLKDRLPMLVRQSVSKLSICISGVPFTDRPAEMTKLVTVCCLKKFVFWSVFKQATVRDIRKVFSSRMIQQTVPDSKVEAASSVLCYDLKYFQHLRSERTILWKLYTACAMTRHFGH